MASRACVALEYKKVQGIHDVGFTHVDRLPVMHGCLVNVFIQRESARATDMMETLGSIGDFVGVMATFVNLAI
jgi:hypothetical protein